MILSRGTGEAENIPQDGL